MVCRASPGKVGCSRLSDVLAGDKTAARRNYMAELICERLTGERTESFTTDAMQWGIDTEEAGKRSVHDRDVEHG